MFSLRKIYWLKPKISTSRFRYIQLYLPSQREIILGLSTEHIARFKIFPKWWKRRGLSVTEWIDIAWLTERIELF